MHVLNNSRRHIDPLTCVNGRPAGDWVFFHDLRGRPAKHILPMNVCSTWKNSEQLEFRVHTRR